MNKDLWWKKPLRVLQTNLAVKDTPLMSPQKIAEQTVELGANTLVMNAGGIYAWYESNVAFHHVNEYLPKDFDLFGEIISECHKRNIRVIARFDFSKAEDEVYQRHPEWFVRYSDGSTRMYAKNRPGKWSLLVTTCLNAGYRNEAVAVPVLREVLERYDIDGIFFNAPHYEFCCCDACKEKYLSVYGKPMPEFPEYGENSPGLPEGLEKDWPSISLKDNMEQLYRCVKSKAPDVPIIIYYNGYRSDHLADRVATADMICTESQDILSNGKKNIPEIWHPAISMRMGKTLEDYPNPFGIIHSCPGMDWRHTGLPSAEYEFWMSQIPANGGTIWHSVSGFAETISDKRILKSIKKINNMAKKAEQAMDGVASAAEILLLWEEIAPGFVEGMMNRKIQFDIACPEQITSDRLRRYRLVIVPKGFPITQEVSQCLKEYTEQGGSIIVECGKPDKILSDVLGTGDYVSKSEPLTSSYLRFEDTSIQQGLEQTPLIPHRGVTWFCQPDKGTKTLATFVPPFAPLDGVGSPPERASILCEKTDIPLVLFNNFGEGKAIYLSFGLGGLISEFGLAEHMYLLENIIRLLLDNSMMFKMEAPAGLQATVFRKQNDYIVHLVNGVGQRPLTDNLPLYNLTFKLKICREIQSVVPLIDNVHVKFHIDGDTLSVTSERLDIWNAFLISCKEEEQHELVDGK